MHSLRHQSQELRTTYSQKSDNLSLFVMLSSCKTDNQVHTSSNRNEGEDTLKVKEESHTKRRRERIRQSMTSPTK